MSINQQQQQAILKNPQAAFQHAVRMLQEGRMAQAEELCTCLTRLVPDFVNAWILLSQIAQQTQNNTHALTCARHALSLAPLHKKATMQLADCLIGEGDVAAAEDRLLALENQSKEDGLISVLVGNLFIKADRYEHACRCFQRAVSLRQNDSESWYLYSGALAGIGDVDGAGEALDRVLALDAKHYEALLSRANLKKQTAESHHVESLKDLLLADQSSEGEVLICYALAKELEDLERYEESFAFLERGACLNDHLLSYDVERDVQSIAAMNSLFEQRINALSGPVKGGAGMVFILGLPRTGSTLTDRILGSHSQVESLGETSDFHYAVLEQAGRVSDGGKLSFLESLAHIDFSALGADYLARVQRRGKTAQRLIDKTPNNALYLGLIQKALPEAKIIHVHKAPMDSCYSMFKAVFKSGYPFSYNVEKLGRYYIAFSEMMQQWRKRLPGHFLDFSYEHLVAEQYRQTEILLAFCELDWEDACLDFHKDKSATATASVIQVRQPIYRSSVQHWKRYCAQLQPLVNQLRAAGIEVEQ